MFSIKESVTFGWDKFKSNKSVWAVSLVILILTYLSGGSDRHHSVGIISFLAIVALIITRVGLTKLFLRIADGESFEWPQALEEMFKMHGVFWKFYLASLLYGLAVALGIILLIVPGLIALATYSFAQLIAIDLKMGPMAAMKESALITKGSRMKILGFLIVIIVLNILGAIIFGLGLFITMPVSMFALINVYRKLSAQKQSLTV